MFFILCTFTIGTLVTLNIFISETSDLTIPIAINPYMLRQSDNFDILLGQISSKLRLKTQDSNAFIDHQRIQISFTLFKYMCIFSEKWSRRLSTCGRCHESHLLWIQTNRISLLLHSVILSSSLFISSPIFCCGIYVLKAPKC